MGPWTQNSAMSLYLMLSCFEMYHILHVSRLLFPSNGWNSTSPTWSQPFTVLIYDCKLPTCKSHDLASGTAEHTNEGLLICFTLFHLLSIIWEKWVDWQIIMVCEKGNTRSANEKWAFILQEMVNGKSSNYLGAIHKLRHTNFLIFYPSSVLVTGGHISETP